MQTPEDGTLIEILKRRDGQETVVLLQDGSRLTVWNIAWGYDRGDVFAHVTSNISPPEPDLEADFFFTSDVVALIDPEIEAVIYETPWSQEPDEIHR